jgi:hypothetical protein
MSIMLIIFKPLYSIFTLKLANERSGTSFPTFGNWSNVKTDIPSAQQSGYGGYQAQQAQQIE